jgi:anti-sigma factor RsiW
MRFPTMRFRRRRSLTCQQVVELVSDYLEGALDPADRTRLEAHLALCDPCVEYVGQIRATVALAARVEPDPADGSTRDRLVELYRSWQEPPG